MALISADSDDLLELESISFYARVRVYNESTRGNEMLQIEHANREYTGRRTYDRYIGNTSSFTASVGLAQARPYKVWAVLCHISVTVVLIVLINSCTIGM